MVWSYGVQVERRAFLHKHLVLRSQALASLREAKNHNLSNCISVRGLEWRGNYQGGPER